MIPYLYRRSEWIKDIFTFVRPVRGGRLDIAIGDSSEVLAKQEVQEFIIELSKIPPPQDVALRMEYNNLLALLKLVSGDWDLTLILSVS